MTTIIVTDVLTITFCLLEYTVVPLYSHTIGFPETSDCKEGVTVEEALYIISIYIQFIVKYL